MNVNQVLAVAEGLLFVAGEEGMTESQLMEVLEIDKKTLDFHMDELKKYYEQPSRGIQLIELGGTYQLTTKEKHADYYKKMVRSPSSATLSQASLEALAIIAYKQPVSRLDVEDIRGVKTERPLRTLQAKGLIVEKGRQEGAGRAILYGTTKNFLDQFGLQSLSELPPLPEVEEEEFDLFYEKFQKAVEETDS
ncbi:SMC-Scp complex subunit ScpB [Alkalicoccus halolimnae]|uniref:Segregation and condensation protein B n=1 Tax=Alkalicoccus halolimnae TaxID=1667239 RepID=A0A5C7FDP7_9BACI|nr:SMC-Scp complex subunit ScpB [Alkalicoccus halolimnae]TXF83047.1 SMC-Scp complex subunit ScpB [Alkalicoccus halolimnae]